jgi:hypothetical protein
MKCHLRQLHVWYGIDALFELIIRFLARFKHANARDPEPRCATYHPLIIEGAHVGSQGSPLGEGRKLCHYRSQRRRDETLASYLPHEMIGRF